MTGDEDGEDLLDALDPSSDESERGGDADGDDGDADGDAGGEASPDESDVAPLDDLRDRVVDDAGAADDALGDAGAADDADRPALDGAVEGGREGPLGDLAAGVDERRQRTSPADDALFDEMDVGDVDSDALWEQVESGESGASTPGRREVRDVDKRKYCQGCPHFATPPDVGCAHEGTDILEQVDMATFKVADCPIVLEDERLEDVQSN